MAAVTICSDFGALSSIKSVTVPLVSPSICLEVMGPGSTTWVYTPVQNKKFKKKKKKHGGIPEGYDDPLLIFTKIGFVSYSPGLQRERREQAY